MEKERHLINLEISPDLDEVKVKFAEIGYKPIPDNAPEGTENEKVRRVFKTESQDRPHKNLVGCMKKLRKHCLAMISLELADQAKQLSDFKVIGIKLKGDLLMEQSRIQIKFGKHAELTGGFVPMETGWFEMFPNEESNSKYVDIAEVTKIVQDIVEEVWSYLFEGKFEETVDPQLALFPNQRTLEKAA